MMSEPRETSGLQPRIPGGPQSALSMYSVLSCQGCFCLFCEITDLSCPMHSQQ
ncbi:hypothetical protein BJX64DRAFT_260306 [Aspergillus heterothallicus]